MKPHTNFRTVPVTERLPETIDTVFILLQGNQELVLETGIYEKGIGWYNKYYDDLPNVKFWLEELSEQVEHESPFCPYCGLMKFNPGNGVMHQLCICTDWSKQAEGKSAEEILKKNIPNGIVNIKAVGKGNGKPQYQAEIDVIIKCMHEFRNQLTPKPTDQEIENAAMIHAKIIKDRDAFAGLHAHVGYRTGAKACRDGKIVKPKE